MRIQAGGKRVTTRHFVFLIAAQEPPLEARTERRPPRLGLVVSRRVGGAVARNRVKRLCRECFRLLPDLLPTEVDLVVIARNGAFSLKLQEVRREWEGVAPAIGRVAAEALARTREQPHVSAGKETPR